MLGDDVLLLPVSNVGITELHAVKLGLTKDGMPCHQQKTLKPSAKVLATTTQCKTQLKLELLMSWMKMDLVYHHLWHNVTGLVLSVWLIAVSRIVLSNTTL